jgi:DNA replication protein DnaD
MKSKTSIKKAANSWLDEIMETKFATTQIDEVPEGWMTLNQMASHAQVHISTMNGRIQMLIGSGILQKKKFRINTGRHVCDVWHYNKA